MLYVYVHVLNQAPLVLASQNLKHPFAIPQSAAEQRNFIGILVGMPEVGGGPSCMAIADLQCPGPLAMHAQGHRNPYQDQTNCWVSSQETGGRGGSWLPARPHQGAPSIRLRGKAAIKT